MRLLDGRARSRLTKGRLQEGRAPQARRRLLEGEASQEGGLEGAAPPGWKGPAAKDSL